LVRERTYVKENYADTYPTRVWVSRETDEVLHVEPLLRRYGPSANADARRSRIRHCVSAILAGGHRDVCRAMVYGEDCWREATSQAGKDPVPEDFGGQL
jgi:hypothetical protein